MAEDPADAVTELAQMAIQMHELYVTYVDAGFTDAQAMQLLCAHVQASAGGKG